MDRTQLAIEPPAPPAAGGTMQFLQAASTPWQTTLAEDVLPGATTIKVMASTKNPTNDSTIAHSSHPSSELTSTTGGSPTPTSGPVGTMKRWPG